MNMKKTLLILAAVFAATPLWAEKNDRMEPWQDPNTFEENRLPMAATFVTDQQKTMSLDGVWKFKWNETIEGRTKGFEAVGYDDSDWGTIPVPGMWELNGYNDPIYLNVGFAWRGHYENNPPYPATEHNYVGQYRRTFSVDKSWIGKQICLCIGSATSNVRVWVNGKMVGYSEDSKLEACFDLTKYVKAGENLIALEVFRWCDGSYLEDQDFWRFSGIARGVCVYTREKERIEDVNITAGMDGAYTVKAKVTKGIKNIRVAIVDKKGNQVSYMEASPSKGQATLTGVVRNPNLWSAEIPDLYTLKVTASDKKDVVESTSIDFGFRTVEIKDSQLLVNGQPVLIKGANRHEINADKGYVVSEADMIKDIRIMKELNMNAVRTCHYPDDPRWYALCDKYGLYVVDEGNIESHGMGYEEASLAHRADFRDAHLSRDQRMLRRDFNHPSVIIWSLGNEAGDGENFTACYKWMKENDPSRPVQYERACGGKNSDIHCPMYVSPAECEAIVLRRSGKPLIQCEYAHAMGNSMGNFKEYWDLIRKYPTYQGGFIWDFVDQALRWPAKDGGTDHIFAFGGDFNEYDPSDGSFNCNGVIASDRTLHPHAYEVRYQHRNIHTSLAGLGKVNVHNEYFFKDLSQYRMHWNIAVDGEAVSTGVVENLNVAPQKTETIVLGFKELPKADADIFLNVSYVLKTADGVLPAGAEVAYDQITLQEKTSAAFDAGSASVCGKTLVKSETSEAYLFSGSFAFAGTMADRVADWTATFDKATGFLTGYTVNGVRMLSEPLTPEFARAPIENDMGAKAYKAMSVWKYPEFRLAKNGLKVSSHTEENVTLTAEYEPIAGGAAIVEMSYTIFADGSVKGVERMKDAGGLAKAPDMFRFGMKFAMPGRYSTVDFYGKGPWENYCDRNSAAVVGHYTQSVNDQYHYGYVRTQESGTKTGLRYFRLLDPEGSGLEITTEGKFSASALPFQMRDLDCMENGTPQRANKTNTQKGEARHSLSLKAKAHENDRANGTTYVNFDLMQMGVGGIHSWGTLPLDQYLVPAAEREFTFVLRPVKN